MWALHRHFGGCVDNDAIIWSMAFGIVCVTALQLSGMEGSLLTSGVVSAYAVYLCYSAVSKNPSGACNPRLADEDDPWGVGVGLLLTAVSLAWTGWSWTAEDRLCSAGGVTRARSLNRDLGNDDGHRPPFRRGQDPLLDLDDLFLEHFDEDRPPSGLALGSSYDNEDGDIIPSLRSTKVWKLNAILALVCCWVSMTLTGWGSILIVADDDTLDGGGGGDNNMQYHTAANPMVGPVNMIMIAISQWMALLLYAWTLVAPRLFPDRDFL